MKTKHVENKPPQLKPAVKRVMIVANKAWEASPLLAVLSEKKATPQKFKLTPGNAGSGPYPRTVCTITDVVKTTEGDTQQPAITQVEIWCIEDWMDPNDASSSIKKARILPSFFSWNGQPPPDFVVAFGTAAFLGDTSFNGCVVIGANAFIFNAWSEDKPTTPDPWDDSAIPRPIRPTLNEAFFKPKLGYLDETLRYEVEARFVAPPLNPAPRPMVLSAYNYTALGVVNVKNYDDYVWADLAAVSALRSADRYNPIGSVETTHGIIRVQSTAPFLFISGIVDRVGQFNAETAPRSYAQNFAGAHNAGVMAAWLIPRIAKFLSTPLP